MSPKHRVVIVNTLGGALEHYTRELVHDFERLRVDVDVLSIDEPSKSGDSSLIWLCKYVRALRAARRLRAPIIVTWPVLGYVDLLIMRLFAGRRASIVVHDPRPLVAARGYGRLAQAVGGLFSGQPIVVHSVQAQRAVDNKRLRAASLLVAHPMLPPIHKHHRVSGSPVVRVLGQYKPDRDIDMLKDLGARFSGPRLEVVGRRWPNIEGWSVRDEYIPEEELAQLVVDSDVVLVPYRRFYQSGIAIRCLEVGTPVVGPKGTSMDALLGADSKLLAGEAWVPPIEFAVSGDGVRAAAHAAEAAYSRAISDWRAWAERQGITCG